MQFTIMWIPEDGSHNYESKVRRKENYCRQFFGLPLHSDVQYTNLYTGSQRKMLRTHILVLLKTFLIIESPKDYYDILRSNLQSESDLPEESKSSIVEDISFLQYNRFELRISETKSNNIHYCPPPEDRHSTTTAENRRKYPAIFYLV